MEVTLKNYTPLQIADDAIGKCWDKPSTNECNIKRIERVANQFKHASTIEHLVYNFDIDGISRACLQELARHRMASYSVKSSRYTLSELRNAGIGDLQDFLVMTTNEDIDDWNINTLWQLSRELKTNISNDLAKYMLPEAYKTSLVWTINARSLQNFLSLRTDKRALWEIRKLAYEVYNTLPDDHKFLFTNFIYKEGVMEIGYNERKKYFDETGMFSTDEEIREYLITNG